MEMIRKIGVSSTAETLNDIKKDILLMKKTTIRFVKIIAVLSVVFYATSMGLLGYFQRSFLYFPTPPIHHGMKEITVDVKDASLKVIVLNEGHENAIVYFGGNGETVALNTPDFEKQYKDYTVYLVNYRGYGGSSGSPTEKALYDDALLIYDRFKQYHKEIAVFGRSLGSGVATYVASQRNVKKLVLITPYDSVQSIAEERFPIYPISWVLLDKFDSIQRAPDIHSDVLILMGDQDEVISNQHSIRLAKAFPKNEVVIERFSGVGHNNIHEAQRYFSLIKSFLVRQNQHR